MSDKAYNTNLASEFYVLSVLHRLGLDATLTLGNKKSVDLAVVRDAGDTATIDVKGLAGKTSWPVDNLKQANERHFLVFVCFKGLIEDVLQLPEVWVIPRKDVDQFVYHAPGGRHVLPRSKLINEAEKYRDAWYLIAGGS